MTIKQIETLSAPGFKITCQEMEHKNAEKLCADHNSIKQNRLNFKLMCFAGGPLVKHVLVLTNIFNNLGTVYLVSGYN